MAIAILGVPRPARGQSTLGTIRGTVWDPQRQAVPKATIVVVDETTSVARASETGPTGDYEVANLKAGTYRIEVRALGFKAHERTGTTLPAGDTVRIDVALEIGSSSETVTVTAAAPVIRLESQAVEGGLDARQLRSLPRNSREFQSFLHLNPNVVGDPDNGFQFLGGRTYGVSYIQDGQPSTGAMFGNIANASPGLEAISELKVLSSSYAAEYGGLAAVVVTTQRGGNRYLGTAFYDFNADELNALTYPQTLAGLKRGFSGSDTHDHQYGIVYGGPIKKNRTFFLANYEAFRRTTVGGGSIVSVPTDRMRAGDFSANSFIVRDPRTGQRFPGDVIPPDRIDPVARRVLDFFYPHANLASLSNGLGRSQAFINLTHTQTRWDGRIDHELSSRDSVFGRVSGQHRNPATSFENLSFPNFGVQDRRLDSRSETATWTRTVSSRLVNDLRGGFVTDRSNRRSHFDAADVAATLGLDIPAGGLGRRGYPAFTFQGANSVRGIADTAPNANRDTRTSTLSVGDTLTWVRGRHSVKVGGQYVRHSLRDGFALGVIGAAGHYIFSGAATGHAFADFLLGLPARVEEGINTRGTNPLDAYSNDVALFGQDDWTIGSALTLFLGTRYEVAGSFVEWNNLLANFNPRTGALVLPSDDIAAFLSPEAQRLPREVAGDLDLGRALVKSDTNNISPRAGFAYRPGENNRIVVRGGAGYFYPTSAAQGIRDALSRSPFRFATVRTSPMFTQGFGTGTVANRSLFALNAVDVNLESAEALQYNLTLEREVAANLGMRVSYLGTRFRKLLVNRDINTVLPSTISFDVENPVDRLRLPYPNLDPFLNSVENGGRGYFSALQLEGRRRWSQGFAFTAAYTLAGSESTAPDLGNSTLGVVQYAPYDLELDRGPDPNVVKHRFLLDATWDVPVGRGRSVLPNAQPWVDALVGGWTVTTIVQVRSGQHLTPFFRYGTDPIFPANTGKAYDTNSSFDEAWRPDVVGDSTGSRRRDNFFNLDAFRLPTAGQVGNARKGLLEGPGTWVVNLGFYKVVARAGRVRAELRATIDNAFNHPQFLVTSSSGFLDLTDFLIDGVRDNGVTNALAEVGSLEGFAPARVVRLGLRMSF